MFQPRRIEVAKILKGQGLKGELKLLPFTDDIGNFKGYTKFFINGCYYEVEYFKDLTRFLVVKLKGIDSVHKAMQYKNFSVMVDRNSIPENEILVDDYLNLEVISKKDKKEIGIISAYIESAPSGIFEITLKNEKTTLVPANLDFFSVPNLEKGWVYLINHEDIITKNAL